MDFLFTIGWGIIEVLATGLEAAVFIHILINKVGLREGIVKSTLILNWLLIVTVITIYNYLTQNSITSIYVYVFLFGLFIINCIKGKLIQKIFWFLFPVAVMCGIDLTNLLFFTHVYGHDFLDYAEQGSLRLLIIIVAKSLLVLFWYIIIHLPSFHDRGIKVTLRYLLVPISSVFLLTFAILGRFVTGIDNNILFIMLAIMFIFINICCFMHYRIKNLQNQNQIEKDDLEQEIAVAIQRQNHAELNNMVHNLQQIRQEINESLQVIWLLARNPQGKDFERYSNQIHKINEQLSHMVITGNPMIDGIIWSKKTLAEKKGIQLEVHIELPEAIKGEELSLLLSNLFNLGIYHLAKPKKTLYVNVQLEGPTFGLRVSLQEDKDSFAQEKEHMALYQKEIDSKVFAKILEMQIIQEVVEQYGGSIFFKHNHTVLILLPAGIIKTDESFNN